MNHIPTAHPLLKAFLIGSPTEIIGVVKKFFNRTYVLLL